jgi:hypothetical protein
MSDPNAYCLSCSKLVYALMHLMSHAQRQEVLVRIGAEFRKLNYHYLQSYAVLHSQIQQVTALKLYLPNHSHLARILFGPRTLPSLPR